MDPWTWTVLQLMEYSNKLDDTSETQIDLFLKQVTPIDSHEVNGNA